MTTIPTNSRAAAEALLASARPERATDEAITDLTERLTRAIETAQVLAGVSMPSGKSRLEGKVQGLKVALGYVQEIQRAERAEVPDPRGELPTPSRENTETTP